MTRSIQLTAHSSHLAFLLPEKCPCQDSLRFSRETVKGWAATGAVTEYQQDLLINRPRTAIKAICEISLQIVAQFVYKTNITLTNGQVLARHFTAVSISIRFLYWGERREERGDSWLTPGALKITAAQWPFNLVVNVVMSLLTSRSLSTLTLFLNRKISVQTGKISTDLTGRWRVDKKVIFHLNDRSAINRRGGKIEELDLGLEFLLKFMRFIILEIAKCNLSPAMF